MTNLSQQHQRAAHQTPVGTLASIDLLNASDRMALNAAGVDSLEDLADLSNDELLDIIGAENMPRETADQIIMAARAHWFEPA